ncbi:hypothetical protein ARMGADRAFT_177279 [Armillaria gallica]|uniref:Transmembrane protein n=1 Tax=Armillaria gallica TaxID=47427 RepID=A0A2H3DSK9_ARMGA|nr:hypothetical protein ARMGADRAFT_177279 [Armillaria gallica]
MKFWDDEETAKRGSDLHNHKERPRGCQLRRDDAECERLGNVRTRTSGFMPPTWSTNLRKMSAYYLLVFAGLFLVVAATICRTETCRLTTPLLASLLFELVLVHRQRCFGRHSFLPTEFQHHFRARHRGRLGEWALVYKSVHKPDDYTRRRCHKIVTSPLLHCTTSLIRRLRRFRKWHVQAISIIGIPPESLASCMWLSPSLMVFLQRLRGALPWTIRAGAIRVSATSMVVASLPVFFLRCPYSSPPLYRCTSYRPIAVMDRKYHFPLAQRRQQFSDAIRCLSHVQRRNTKSSFVIESRCMQQMSTSLAAEARDWLFSVSSNSRMQSIVA